MRILIINTVATDKNGITNVIFNYLEFINSNKITFDLVARNPPDSIYVETVEKQGGKLYVINKFGNIFRYIWNLRKLVQQNSYDAVHVHGNSHTIIIELIGIWLGGCKKRIIHGHNTCSKSLLLHKLLKLPFDFLCTHRLACGKAAGHFMFGSKPFVVVNNGIDVVKFKFNEELRNSVRKKLNLRNEEVVVGHVGSFIPAKNQSFIVDVFNEFCKRRPSRLVLIGDGSLRKDVEKKALDLGILDNIIFTGNIGNINEILNGLDVILMPSKFEGLPLTLVEQQANGLKCVVSENITRETDKTGNLTFLSLDAPIKDWADMVENHVLMNNRAIQSEKAISLITNSGYNIREESKKLEEYYLNL